MYKTIYEHGSQCMNGLYLLKSYGDEASGNFNVDRICISKNYAQRLFL
jgi:hypothetical protein